MHSVKHLTNKKIKEDLLEEFLTYMNEELAIDEPYSVFFVDDKDNASEALGKTAMYNPSTKSVYVYVTNRHPKDIMRSIAHELVHHKQHCNGDLENMSLEKAEVEANAGGYFLRKFEDGRKSVNEQKTPEYREGNFPQLSTNPERFEKEVGGGCKSGYKPMKIGRKGPLDQRACMPTLFADKFEGYDLYSLTPDLFTANLLAQALKDIEKRGKDSPFITKLVRPSLTNAILANQIILNDIKTLEDIGDAFKPGEDYILNREKYVKELRTYKEKLEKYLKSSKVQEQQGKKAPQPPKLPVPPKNFRLFSKSEVEAATRILYLLRDGVLLFPGRTVRESDIIGKKLEDWIFGANVNNFGRAYKVPTDRMRYYKGLIPKSESEKADAIVGVNAGGASVIKYGGRDVKADPTRNLQDTLDIIGMSPDSFGIGVASDVFNAFLYLIRWVAEEGADNLVKGDYKNIDFYGAKIPTNENFYNMLISLAGVTVFGDTLKIERGPLAKLARSIQKFDIRLRSGVVRTADLAYLKTLEPLFNALLDWGRYIRDARGGFTGALSTSLQFAGYSSKKAKELVTKVFGETGEPKWLQTMISSAQRTKSLLKAYDQAMTEVSKLVTRKMNGAWAEGILKLIDDEVLERVLKKYFESLLNTQLGKDLISLRPDETVASTAAAMVDEALSTQALKARYVREIYEWLLSPKARELIIERFKVVVLDQLGNYIDKADISDVGELAIAFNKAFDDFINTTFKGASLDEMLGVALKSEGEDVAQRSLRNYVEKGSAEAGAAAAGAAARRGLGIFVKKPLLYAKNFFIKNIFAGEGIGGLLYVKLAKSAFNEALAVLKAFESRKLLLAGFKLVFFYFKFVFTMIAGKINVYLNLYTRYYRPVCGARNFKVFTQQVMIPIINKLGNAMIPFYGDIKRIVTSQTLSGAKPKVNVERDFWDSLTAPFKTKTASIMQGAKSLVFNNDGSFTIGSKTIACKNYKEVKNLPETLKVVKELQKEVLSIEKLADQELKKLISEVENEINREKAQAAQPKQEPTVQEAFKSVKDTTKKMTDEFNKRQNELTRQRRAAVQASAAASRRLREARKKDAAKGRTAQPPRTPAGKPPAAIAKPPAQQPKSPFLDDPDNQQQQENTNRSLSDYRKDILNERLEKLTIGFTE